MLIHEDRLFPADPATRAVARRLYDDVRDLPIVSPHGHTDPRWYAENEPFPDPAQLFVVPDHYVFRMLYSQGVPLEELGIRRRDGGAVETRSARRSGGVFAEHYHLFRGTPTRIWLDHAFATLFGIERAALGARPPTATTTASPRRSRQPEFRPRALFERFNIEVIATTDSPLDDSAHGTRRSATRAGTAASSPPTGPIRSSIPSSRAFATTSTRFGEITGEDTSTWRGYLAAHRKRRAFFKTLGATSTDHGHPTARTADLAAAEAEALFAARRGAATPRAEDAELFRAQMLTEMARMSLEDGLVMQLHPGSFRNHNPALFARFGRDMGADIPTPTDYVRALKPLLDRFGNEPRPDPHPLHARRDQLRRASSRRSPGTIRR